MYSSNKKKRISQKMETDHEQLLEEIDAIDAIYPENIIKRLEDSSIITIRVPQHEYITVQISFPSNYPSEKPPHLLEVSVSKSLKRRELFDIKYLKHLFQEVLDSNFHQGSVCLFDFLTELDGILYMENEDCDDENIDEQATEKMIPTDPFEGWVASDPITDRGSTFIAFAAHVTSEEEAFAKLDLLKTDSKMRKASHIMSAWRIKCVAENNSNRIVTYQDSDDDGETAAGSRMLHLISIMDVWNCIVIVSRFFTGGHIGPDRFKHINSTAREAVVRAGFDKNSKQ